MLEALRQRRMAEERRRAGARLVESLSGRWGGEVGGVELREGELVLYRGDYAYYLEKKEEERAEAREKELATEREAKRKTNKEKQKAREARRKKAA